MKMNLSRKKKQQQKKNAEFDDWCGLEYRANLDKLPIKRDLHLKVDLHCTKILKPLKSVIVDNFDAVVR